MTYPELCAAMARKVAGYSLAQCEYALLDCHEVAAIWRDSQTDYTRKIWAEIDALRDRIASLSRTRALLD